MQTATIFIHSSTSIVMCIVSFNEAPLAFKRHITPFVCLSFAIKYLQPLKEQLHRFVKLGQI